jgi:hypothetical protein
MIIAYRDKKVVGVFVRFSLRRFISKTLAREGDYIYDYHQEIRLIRKECFTIGEVSNNDAF